MKFVIFHGAFGTINSNWFQTLKEQLEVLNQEVILHQFPIDSWDEIIKEGKDYKPKYQTLENWLKEFEINILPLITDEKVCFIGHSLSPLFILHLLSKFDIKIDSAIFVSPFLELKYDDNVWPINTVNKEFYSTHFDFLKLKEQIPISYVLYSDNDPYVDKNESVLFGKSLDSSLIYVKRAGHMNSEVNLNEFPLVLELCKTRIDFNLYQQYMLHKAEREAIELFNKGKEGFIVIDPKEVDDEGLFHFKNLKKSGFATWNIEISDYWMSTDNYFENARKAAKRIPIFQRVLFVRNKEDLENPNIKDFIKRDSEAGIKMYYCLLKDIEKIIPNLDFGIWDEDYVCIVNNSKDNVEKITLDSRKETIEKANKWKEQILKHSKLIK